MAILIRMLDAPSDAQVRQALARLDASNRTDSGRPWLRNQQQPIVRALANLGPAARPAVPKLLRWLACSRSDDVEQALYRIGPDASSIRPLFSLVRREQLRVSAGRALAAADEEVLRQSLPTLTEQLRSSDDTARAYAAFCIGRLGSDGKPLVADLRKLLRVDQDAVAMAAAFALGRIGAAAGPAAADIEELLQAGQSDQVQREFRHTLKLLRESAPADPATPLAGQSPAAAGSARFRIVAFPSYESNDDRYGESDPLALARPNVRPAKLHILALNNAGLVAASTSDKPLVLTDLQWQPLKLAAQAETRRLGWGCRSLNELGQFAGECGSTSRSCQAFYSRNEKLAVLPALFEKPRDRTKLDCGATGLNNRGLVVGRSEIAAKDRDSIATRRALSGDCSS